MYAHTYHSTNSLKTTLMRIKEVPQDVKVDVIKKIVRPTLLNGSETWILSERLNAKEMRYLKRIEERAKKHGIRNETHRQRLKLKPICKKVVEAQMRWVGRIYRRNDKFLARRVREA